MMKVGITGGIGSGKSTVCRLFAQRGVAVYDSDAAAKRLMTEEPALRAGIAARFGAEAYAGGALNRPYLAAKVFSDPAALADLNALVHPAVMADFAAWAERQEGSYVILESAILFANSINFFTNPFVGAVGEHQELHVLPREVSHVGLTVKAVVSHDNRCREAQHLKLP